MEEGGGCSQVATAVKQAPSLCSDDEPEEAEVQNTQRVLSAAEDVKTYWCAAYVSWRTIMALVAFSKSRQICCSSFFG